MDFGTILLIFLGLIFIIRLLAPNPEVEEYDYNDKLPDLNLDKKEDEKIYHHPTTGYSGNWKNMEAYITNRERDLKNKQNEL